MIEAIVWIILVCKNEVLLLKRPLDVMKDKSFEYSLVGGHVEKGEALLDAAVRETFEEVGLRLNKQDLKLQHVIDRKKGNLHKVHFFFLVNNNQCKDKVVNKEPNKHHELVWVNLKKLPSEIGPLANTAIQSLQNHEMYSNYGWE